MKVLDRYSTAIHATSLKPEANTTWADLDVIAAAGLAARHEPLGIALARMLSGGGQGEVIAILTSEAYERSFRIKQRVTLLEAADISRAVLAWFSHGTCQPCGGTGFARIKDTPSLGDECQHCQGTGKIPFDKQFQHEHRELARWLHDQIGQTQARAGQQAMKKLADFMDF